VIRDPHQVQAELASPYRGTLTVIKLALRVLSKFHVKAETTPQPGAEALEQL
jgi:hypothetical protein